MQEKERALYRSDFSKFKTIFKGGRLLSEFYALIEYKRIFESLTKGKLEDTKLWILYSYDFS